MTPRGEAIQIAHYAKSLGYVTHTIFPEHGFGAGFSPDENISINIYKKVGKKSVALGVILLMDDGIYAMPENADSADELRSIIDLPEMTRIS